MPDELGAAVPVVVISADWKTRTLLTAQLDHEGFEAFGVDSIPEAYNTLKRQELIPALVIIDTLSQDIKFAFLELLAELCAGAALLLISGAADSTSSVTWPGNVFSLSKPVSIGQIAVKAAEIARLSSKSL